MRALREALAGFRRAPLLGGLSVISISLSLAILGLFGLVAHNVDLALTEIEERVQVVAYLQDDAPTESVDLARQEIRSFPEVSQVRHITKVEALHNASRELPEFSDAFADLEVNPLPASIEVELEPDHRTPGDAATVADRLRSYSFVSEVRYGQDWVERVHSLRRVAAGAAAILGGGFAVAAVLLIVTAVRMSIVARRDAIFIMQSVGATDGYIRRPFLLEGLLTGLAGGVLALLLTGGVYWILDRVLFSVAWLPDLWVAGGIFGGGLLGMLAAALAVRKEIRPYRAV